MGEMLLAKLERRLDNVVYRLGFGSSRAQARQLVRHGHVRVNDRRLNIPSFQVRGRRRRLAGAARGQERAGGSSRWRRSRAAACPSGWSWTPPA